MENINKHKLNTMEPTKSWSMRQLYRQTKHIVDNGIQGYNLIKKYEDPGAIIKSKQQSVHKRKLRALNRGSYLQDQYRIKKHIPGVCTYDLLQKQVPKQDRKRNDSHKKTFLDDEISIKKDIPAPGVYNVLQMMGSKTIGTNINKKVEGKITYLDHAQYEGSLTPGVGQYIIPRSIRSKTQHNKGSLEKKPKQWKEYHKQMQKKFVEKIKQTGPGTATYDPKPVQYQLFQQKKKVTRVGSQIKAMRQKVTRFRTQSQILKNGKTDIGPVKYSILNQWAHPQKNKKGILQLISKAPTPNIYYG